MPNAPAPGSPEWWLARLEARLDARRPALQRYEDYYSGRQRLAFSTSKFRETFGGLFRGFADNWCDLVVDVAVERLNVQGFRFGDTREADDKAWNIWQANYLDADATILHTETGKNGEAAVIVQPGDPYPQITIEHPSQVIVEYAPGSRHQRAAALKKWLDSDGYERATVYLPEAIYRYRSQKPVDAGIPGSTIYSTSDQKWAQLQRDGVVPNPLGVVPVVPFQNNPTLLGGGQSDIAKVIPIQDAVNKIWTDLIVASEYQGFRQRWATGIEIPTDPETGQPLTEGFLSSVSRMWTVADEGAQFGEFGQIDLSPYVKAIEMAIQHIAAQTRTPPHYLLGQSGAFPSGESLKATETGLTAKVRRKMTLFGESWEEAMRLAFRLMGDEAKGNELNAETVWQDPESKSEAEITDAALKQRALGVPFEMVWETLGYSQEEIKRMVQLAHLPEVPPPGATVANAVGPTNANTNGTSGS